MKDPDEPPPEGERHLQTLETILERVREHGDSPNVDLIRDAFELARVVHGDQRRR